MIKYRRRSPDERPKAIEGSFPLEVLWTAIPTLIVAVIFVWSSALYFRNSEAPKGSMEVFVTGKQWMWKVEHPEGQREINELHVPLGPPGQADDDFGRRDSRFFCSRVPRQEGRFAGTLHVSLV